MEENEGITLNPPSRLGNMHANQSGDLISMEESSRASRSKSPPTVPEVAKSSLENELSGITFATTGLPDQSASVNARSTSSQNYAAKNLDKENQQTAVAGSVPGDSRAASNFPSHVGSSRISPTEKVQKEGHQGKRSESPDVKELRKELEAAKQQIALMDHQITQSRFSKSPMDQSLGSPSALNPKLRDGIEELIGKFNANNSLGSNSLLEDSRSDTSGCVSPHPFDGTFGNMWNGPNHPALMQANTPTNYFHGGPGWDNSFNGYHSQNFRSAGLRFPSKKQFDGRLDTTFGSQQYGALGPVGGFDMSYRNFQRPGSRSSSAMGPSRGDWTSHPGSLTSSMGFSPPITPSPYSHGFSTFQGRASAHTFSPTAPEFGIDSVAASPMGSNFNHPWNNMPGPSTQSGSNYVAPVEPINYRRLLDRNMSCNWKYIVDKIVCSNDQQASIFLQQKLKISTSEQKFELVEAIIAQAYPLMINRFGNFLIQRCFEHGTPEQVISIANAIRGHVLDLSMDAFGCHVVQKAFDVVPEEYKAIFVHELLRRIPETVIHRYACHVWQKLFELRWSDSPPQIMKYVNEALKGMWHEVALGETGSLVVQNIFENCLDEDKRPCINEVLSNVDVVSHGQFGNWCIQHICEHGAPADRSRATEHVLRFATEYSTDQFASKVVEKCLKVGGSDFLGRYLEKVCEGRPDRPRMPLIDIAGDQYGNYLVQYILMHADNQHRELVAQHVRKHMVSLRGSKFGSRVAMLCCNPAVATRPGPPSAMPLNDRFFQNSAAMAMNRMSMSNPFR